MKLGIYVGSFNPPHRGHLKVVEYVLNKKLVDKVLILPTPSYWDKKDFVSDYHRINMLKFFEKDNIIIDDIHNKDQYTYQTLNSIKKDYPNDEWFLIIGSDNLLRFHEWKNVNEILKNHVIVLKRDSIIKNEHLKEYDDRFIYCEDFSNEDISSTKIRGNIEVEDIPEIKKYIEENHLYEWKDIYE